MKIKPEKMIGAQVGDGDDHVRFNFEFDSNGGLIGRFDETCQNVDGLEFVGLDEHRLANSN